jgi:hypothetical protein
MGPRQSIGIERETTHFDFNTRWDLASGAVALTGMAIIIWSGWRTS